MFDPYRPKRTKKIFQCIFLFYRSLYHSFLQQDLFYCIHSNISLFLGLKGPLALKSNKQTLLSIFSPCSPFFLISNRGGRAQLKRTRWRAVTSGFLLGFHRTPSAIVIDEKFAGWTLCYILDKGRGRGNGKVVESQDRKTLVGWNLQES